MTARATTDLDKLLGQRVRALRIRAGLSQPELADAIGVSSQQVQKYEVGSNRIPATRIIGIADALNVSTNELLEAISSRTNSARAKPAKAYPDSPEAHVLLQAFSGIKSKPLQRRVLELVQMMIETAPLARARKSKR